MKWLMFMLCLITLSLSAQPRKVTESLEIEGQRMLKLDFDFADNITFELWNKNEILVEVNVEIADGEYNDIFSLSSSKTSSVISIEMDANMWEKIDKDSRKEWNCGWKSRIDYTVYLPRGLEVTANTISGDYEFDYYGTPMFLKTISGAIDVTIPESEGLDFYVKTISGEVYSNLDISYPYGKEGLRQIVGQEFKGRINNGSEESEFETISGNIYLRKG